MNKPPPNIKKQQVSGDRVRKESKYGEGGRAVGGEARRRAMQKVVLGAGRLKAQMAAQEEEEDDEFPPPGGHSIELSKKAAEDGFEIPGGKSNAFARLKAVADRNALLGGIENEDGDEEEDDEELLDEILQLRGGQDREPRPESEAEETLAKARARLPILRTGLSPKAKPVPEMPALEIELEKISPEMWHASTAIEGQLAEARGATKEEAREGVKEEARKIFESIHNIPISEEERSKAASVAQTKAGVTKYTPEQELEIARIMGTPGVVCNNCSASETCPAFKENSVCAFEDDLAGLSTRDTNNLLPILQTVADLQNKRARRATMIEAMSTGGHLDPNVTRQLEIAATAAMRVQQVQAAMSQTPTNTVKQTLIVQQTTEAPSGEQQPQQGGILTQLLAAMTPKKELPPKQEIVVVESPKEEVKEELIPRTAL